jgi:beta-1,4-mannosyl-glycoprotein beta-1,4-N-acetylglucosaminyltransferase
MEYYDVVDYFVLVESTKSHTGKQKELIYLNNKDKFKKYHDKIIHIIVDDLPDYSVADIWKAENFQRRCINRGLNGLVKNGDKVFISDCDEFWDTETAFKNINKSLIVFTQELYYYYVNCLQNQLWNGSIMYTYNPSIDIQVLRDNRNNHEKVSPGGWHYSFMGGASKIKEKVENIAESHYIIDKIGDVSEISVKMNKAIDLWGRNESFTHKRFIKSNYLPKKIDEFLKEYPYFIKEGV